ncbi:MAG: hypothetical protein LBK55_00600 [Azoarcus sp.]|jgi:hypothetical protein|nr:hypothetical protein [Azoarcus sp.]
MLTDFNIASNVLNVGLLFGGSAVTCPPNQVPVDSRVRPTARRSGNEELRDKTLLLAQYPRMSRNARLHGSTHAPFHS